MKKPRNHRICAVNTISALTITYGISASMYLFAVRPVTRSGYIGEFIYFQLYDVTGFIVGGLVAWGLLRADFLNAGSAAFAGITIAIPVATFSGLDGRYGTGVELTIVFTWYLGSGILYGAVVGTLFAGVINVVAANKRKSVSRGQLALGILAPGLLLIPLVWLRALQYAF